MMDTILNPTLWLALVALGHAVVGMIIPTDWSKDNNKMMAGFTLLTSFTMLYAAFMMDGEEQARLALVIAGPVWVWFVVSISMKLEFDIGKEPMVMTWKENAPPLVLWGMVALSGLLASGWV
jgi:NADH:ubiquinone oxidoreductase subunit 6 (subunit J)